MIESQAFPALSPTQEAASPRAFPAFLNAPPIASFAFPRPPMIASLVLLNPDSLIVISSSTTAPDFIKFSSSLFVTAFFEILSPLLL